MVMKKSTMHPQDWAVHSQHSTKLSREDRALASKCSVLSLPLLCKFIRQNWDMHNSIACTATPISIWMCLIWELSNNDQEAVCLHLPIPLMSNTTWWKDALINLPCIYVCLGKMLTLTTGLCAVSVSTMGVLYALTAVLDSLGRCAGVAARLLCIYSLALAEFFVLCRERDGSRWYDASVRIARHTAKDRTRFKNRNCFTCGEKFVIQRLSALQIVEICI